MEKAWEVGNTTESFPEDDLLVCLILLSKYYDFPRSATALTAGLPLNKGKLSVSSFPISAARANLHAEVKMRKLDSISERALPAVLILKNQQACILVGIDSKKAQIVLPQNKGEISTVSLDDLADKYLGYLIFIRPKIDLLDDEIQTNHKSKDWFWSVLKKAIPLYGEIILASLLINLFALVVPLFVMNVYNRVIPNNATETLWVLASGVLIVFIFDFILKMLRSYFIDSSAKITDIQISSSLFSHALNIKMGKRPQSIGAFANAIQAFDLFRDFITSITISVLVDIPFFFLFVAVLFMLGGNIGFIPLVLTPIIFLVGFISQESMVKLTQQTYKYNAEKQSALYESLGNIETIKTIGAEGQMQSRWEQAVGLAANLGTKIRWITNIGINFSALVQQLITVLIVIFGVYLVAKNELTTGGLIACVIIGSRSLMPVIQASLILNKYIQAKNAIYNIEEIMALPIENSATEKPIHLKEFKGNIHFEKVSFSYDEKALPVLKDISFNIQPGEKIGIIGRLGSGKSTIGKLIMGLYQVSDGHVLLENIDITQLDLTDVRRSIAYVPQEIKLFNTSIRQNIIMGHPCVDDTQLLKAVDIAGVSDFTKTHPHGLDCNVGENGQNLSGGQCQTIAIARSLIGNATMFVFDEPTNSMDDKTALQFMRKFTQNFCDKTMVVITHKASVLQFVDRLLVIEQGRIIADGPRQDILDSLNENSAKNG